MKRGINELMIDENAESYDKIIELKKLILHQLSSSKDLNMRYKLRLDFLHNRDSDNYVKMMEKRTGLSERELYIQASTFVKDISKWVYNELKSKSDIQLADLSNDPSKLDEFLAKVRQRIGEDGNDIFLQKCDKRVC